MNQTTNNESYQDYDEIDLREVCAVLGKWKKTIIGVTLGAMLISGIISFFLLTPIYEARIVITGVQMKDLSESNQTNYIVKDESEFHRINEKTINLPVPEMELSNYLELVQSSWVLDKTIEHLQLGCTRGQLKNMIEAQQPKDQPFIEIKIKNKDPEMAAKIGNTLVDELQIYVKKVEGQQINRVYRVLEKQQAVAQADLDASLKKLAAFRVQSANNTNTAQSIADQVEERKLENAVNRKNDVMDLLNAKMLELKLTQSFVESEDNIVVLSPAVSPENPVKPNKTLNVAIAGILGLMCSVFGVFLAEYLRKDPDTN